MQIRTITKYDFVKLSFTLDKETNEKLNEMMREEERTRSVIIARLIRAEYSRQHPDA